MEPAIFSGKLKHSKLGIISFLFFIISLIPIALIGVNILFQGIITKILHLSYFQVGIFIDVQTFILITFPIIAFILSIIDLKKPNRSRVLPRITLIFVSLIFGLAVMIGIISAYMDISRMLNS